MASGNFQVKVEGLDEIVRALYRVDKTVGRGFTNELKEVADVVAARVRRNIMDRGLYDPARAPSARTGTAGAGPMVNKVNVLVVGRRHVIVQERQRRISKSYPGGYDYPKRYEYGAGGARSFMRPAVEQTRPLLEAKLRAWLERMIAEARW